ncbi:MAG: porin [Mucinivorans sp.]
MKNSILLLGALLLTPFFCEQKASAEEPETENKTLFSFLTNGKSKPENSKFNLYLNMQGSFDADFRDGFQQGAFKMGQLRIEAKGNVNSWLSYRYRQRLNRSSNGSGNIDNLPGSIDYAMLGFKLSDDWALYAGKQSTAYGGFEFDLNPIEVYEYSNMIENMNNFMTGLNLTYQLTPSQQLQLQVLDSRNGSATALYGSSPKIIATKMPLVYTLNWNGTFADKFKTRWSASVLNESKDKKVYYFAFGNELTLNKFNMYFDVMYSIENIDRKGIITSMIPEEYRKSANGYHNVFDVSYLSLVTKLNYRFCPKWNVFVKGMYETASVSKSNSGIVSGRYRNSYGYLGGVEYYPMKSNLHFFLTYVGRAYDFTHRSRLFGNENYNTNRLSLGFIYQLPVL